MTTKEEGRLYYQRNRPPSLFFVGHKWVDAMRIYRIYARQRREKAKRPQKPQIDEKNSKKRPLFSCLMVHKWVALRTDQQHTKNRTYAHPNLRKKNIRLIMLYMGGVHRYGSFVLTY